MFVFEYFEVYNYAVKPLMDMNKKELQNSGQDSLTNMSNKIKRIPNEGLFMSVSKKAEKITTALYMLTDLIPESDPMRHQIRSVSLSVLSDTRTLTYSLTGDLHFHVGKIISKSWELVSLTEVCVVVGFISDMNFGILKNALIEFISDLRNRQRIEGFKRLDDMKLGEGEASNITLSSDFFKVDEVLSPPETQEPPVILKDISKRHFEKEMSFRKPAEKTPSFMANHESSVNRIGERKSKVEALVREKKDISISDILLYFKDYSSKTILRDLNNLKEEGKISKTGDRRWTRYSAV